MPIPTPTPDAHVVPIFNAWSDETGLDHWTYDGEEALKVCGRERDANPGAEVHVTRYEEHGGEVETSRFVRLC